MEDLPLGRIAALVTKFAVKDLPFGRTLMMMMMMMMILPNIFLSILFKNNLNLCSSLKMRDQVSQPYNKARNIIVLYVLILIFFLESRRTTKFSQVNNSMHFPFLFV